jgi:hypothetical protein
MLDKLLARTALPPGSVLIACALFRPYHYAIILGDFDQYLFIE